MSTKKIHEALELLGRLSDEADELVRDALAEVEAIEKAAKAMMALAPAEVVAAFSANRKDPVVLKWLSGYDLLLGIAQESGK